MGTSAQVRSRCSDDPATFSEGTAPFGAETAYFTIDMNDPAHCVPADHRVTLLGR